MSLEHKVVKVDMKKEGLTTKDISNTLDEHCRGGWKLVSITPITAGAHVKEQTYDGGTVGGYSYTSWLMITFSR